MRMSGKLKGWISLLSLRFDDAGFERGFLVSKSSKLKANAFKSGMSIFVAQALNLLQRELLTPAGELPPLRCKIRRRGSWAAAVMGLIGLTVAMVTKVQQRTNFASPQFVEKLVVVSALLCLICGLVSEEWYMARLHGIADPVIALGHDNYDDTFVVLLIDVAMTFTNNVLPARWCAVWPFCLVCAICYPVLVCTLGSPHDVGGVMPYALTLFLLTWCNILGKLTRERYERRAFVELLKEKTMRVETEFKLSQLSEAAERNQPGDALHETKTYTSDVKSMGSLPSTCGTDRLFKDIHEEKLEDRLQKMADVGLKERWLIDAADLRLSPDTVLGAGAFGVVTLGSFMGTPVAVKVSRRAADAESVAQLPVLVNELRVLRHVRHPNIALFHGAVINPSESSVALILEFVSGQPLDRFVQGEAGSERFQRSDTMMEGLVAHRPTDRDSHCILLGLCRALAYLHGNNIVHGDLKPPNVLIEKLPKAKAKLLDFGLSRVLTKRAPPLGGTLKYLAPELVESFGGCGPRPTTAADIFSFGRLLHFTVAGYSVFDKFDERSIQKMLFEKQMPEMTWPSKSILTPFAKGMAAECTQLECTQRPGIRGILPAVSAWDFLFEEDEGRSQDGIKSPAPDQFIEWSAGMQKMSRALQASTRTRAGGTPRFHEKVELQSSDSSGSHALASNRLPTAGLSSGGRANPRSLAVDCASSQSNDLRRDCAQPTIPRARAEPNVATIPTGSQSSRPPSTTSPRAEHSAGTQQFDTPQNTVTLALLMILQRVSCEPVVGQSCCRFHTACLRAEQVLNNLSSWDCQGWNEADVHQCPECKILFERDDQSGSVGKVECDVCGRVVKPWSTRQPRRCEEPGGTTVVKATMFGLQSPLCL